jgi:hypothetical protein
MMHAEHNLPYMTVKIMIHVEEVKKTPPNITIFVETLSLKDKCTTKHLQCTYISLNGVKMLKGGKTLCKRWKNWVKIGEKLIFTISFYFLLFGEHWEPFYPSIFQGSVHSARSSKFNIAWTR